MSPALDIQRPDASFYEDRLACSEAQILSLLVEKARLERRLAVSKAMEARATQRFEKVKCTLICAALFVGALIMAGAA